MSRKHDEHETSERQRGGVAEAVSSHRPPPDPVPQALELEPVELSVALSLDETLRSKKLSSK